MVRPQKIVDSLIQLLENSNSVSNGVNYLDHEADLDTEAVKLPVVELQIQAMNDENLKNKDFVGFQTNDAGQDIGRIYRRLYSLEIDLTVFSAEGSKVRAREIGNNVRDELYERSSSGAADFLVDPKTGEKLDEVWKVSLASANQADDLSTSPPLRRWRQTVIISASEQYVEDANEPITAFEFGTDPE